MRLDAQDRAEILVGIKEEGSTGVWTKAAKTPKDPDKPWLGSDTVPTAYPVACLFVDAATAQAFIRAYALDTEVSFRSLYGILGWEGIDLAVGEKFTTKGGKQYIAKRVATATPADVPIFFIVEFDA